MPLSAIRIFSTNRLLALGALALTAALGVQASGTSPLTHGATMASGGGVVTPVAFRQDGSKLVKVQAVAEKTHLVAGETNWLGLVFNISRDWHIYWRNPGGGMPTSWEVTKAPDGIELGEAVWPTPERYETDFGLDFVHYGRAFVMVPVTVDAAMASKGEVTIEIEASWLVCKDICVPGSGKASITLPITSNPDDAEDTRTAKVFEKAREESPKVVDDLADAGVQAKVGDAISITKPGADELTFFPYENDEGVYPSEAKADLHAKGDSLSIRYYDNDLKLIEEVRGLLVVNKGSESESFEITIPLRR
ncbi:MAG: hypothetical protein Tsb0013_21940 [Phycisphaerales bacterium]